MGPRAEHPDFPLIMAEGSQGFLKKEKRRLLPPVWTSILTASLPCAAGHSSRDMRMRSSTIIFIKVKLVSTLIISGLQILKWYTV